MTAKNLVGLVTEDHELAEVASIAFAASLPLSGKVYSVLPCKLPGVEYVFDAAEFFHSILRENWRPPPGSLLILTTQEGALFYGIGLEGRMLDAGVLAARKLGLVILMHTTAPILIPDHIRASTAFLRVRLRRARLSFPAFVTNYPGISKEMQDLLASPPEEALAQSLYKCEGGEELHEKFQTCNYFIDYYTSQGRILRKIWFPKVLPWLGERPIRSGSLEVYPDE